MADDRKHTERVPVYLTEREMVDASREAIRQDRKVGELIRHVFREYLYGHSGCGCDDLEGTKRPEKVQRR